MGILIASLNTIFGLQQKRLIELVVIGHMVNTNKVENNFMSDRIVIRDVYHN